MRKKPFLKWAVLFAFLALFPLTHGHSQETSRQPTEPKKMEITLPIIGTKIPIKKQHELPLLIAGIFFVLVYYLPKGYVSMRESMSQVRSDRAALELEQMRLQLLKMQYEIAALQKEHKLQDIALPGVPETKIQERTKSGTAVRDRQEQKRQAILHQIENIDVRKRFVFRRLFAFGIDYFLYILFFSFVIAFFIEDQALFNIASYASLIAFPLYFLAMWTSRGATIGKMIMGLRVVRADGSVLSFKHAFVRFLLWAPLGWLLFWWILWDKNRQTLYDKAAGTLVVLVRKKREREF